MESSAQPPVDVIAEALAAHLGPSTAFTAVRASSSRLGLRAAEVSAAEAGRLVEALRPVLLPLLGREDADAVLAGIRRALR